MILDRDAALIILIARVRLDSLSDANCLHKRQINEMETELAHEENKSLVGLQQTVESSPSDGLVLVQR